MYYKFEISMGKKDLSIAYFILCKKVVLKRINNTVLSYSDSLPCNVAQSTDALSTAHKLKRYGGGNCLEEKSAVATC